MLLISIPNYLLVHLMRKALYQRCLIITFDPSNSTPVVPEVHPHHRRLQHPNHHQNRQENHPFMIVMSAHSPEAIFEMQYRPEMVSAYFVGESGSWKRPISLHRRMSPLFSTRMRICLLEPAWIPLIKSKMASICAPTVIGSLMLSEYMLILLGINSLLRW